MLQEPEPHFPNGVEQENVNIVPVRAHHIIKLSEKGIILDRFFIAAFVDHSVDENNIRKNAALILQHASPSYVVDTYSNDPKLQEQAIQGEIAFYKILANLKDTDKVSIGSIPDGICTTRIIGNHCIRRDSFKYADPVDEKYNAEILFELLLTDNPSLREYIDYEWVERKVSLIRNQKQEEVKIVQLVINVGVLRKGLANLRKK